jgi:hypothetical protein
MINKLTREEDFQIVKEQARTVCPHHITLSGNT